MTGDQGSAGPVFMREVRTAQLSRDLEISAPLWIEENAVNKSNPLSQLRQAAYTTLKRIGLPHSGSEEFSFIRVGEFLPHFGPPIKSVDKANVAPSPSSVHTLPTAAELSKLIFSECRNNFAVFVDGQYAPSLSHPGSDFKIRPWKGENLRELLEVVSIETDAATALAMLFSPEPVLIEIAAKARPSSPLQILHYRTTAHGQVISPIEGKTGSRTDAFIVIDAGSLSETRFITSHFMSNDESAEAKDSMENVHSLLLLKEGAHVQFLESGCESEKTSPGEGDSTTIHFRKLTARLAKHSHLLALSAHTGSRLMRNSFSLDLLGEGADAEVNGAVVLTGRRQSHNFLRIRHMVPNCSSRQHFKSVVAGSSRSSVDGTIYVAQDAQGTNANQLINNLMLSDDARSDSKPQLMIHADDVKCTHGTTIGKLDLAQQFYLESRGLTEAQARTLMTVAFIAEILNKTGTVPNNPIHGSTSVDANPSSFRSRLDHALLDTLKLHLPLTSGERSVRHA